MTAYAESGPTAQPIPPALHELEADVLDVVWDRGSVSVREVMQVLNAAAPRKRAYTTYMTIMSRLDTKGLLDCRRHGRTNVYTATFTRDQYVDMRARAELESVVDRYGDVALAHIARQMAALDPERRRALERIARRK